MANGNDKTTPKPGYRAARLIIESQRAAERTARRLRDMMPGWLKDPDILAEAREDVEKEEKERAEARAGQPQPAPTPPEQPQLSSLPANPDLSAAPASAASVEPIEPEQPAELAPAADTPTPVELVSQPANLTLVEPVPEPADPAPALAPEVISAISSSDGPLRPCKDDLSPEQQRCYDVLEKSFSQGRVPTRVGYKELEDLTGFKRDVIRRALAVFDPTFADAKKSKRTRKLW